MPTQASIQAKVNRGFGKAAAALGASCAWYRPASALNPLAQANQRGMLQAAFQVPNTQYASPSQPDKPLWWGLFDATDVQAGDYLAEPSLGTFYVASLEPIHYPLCVRCNRTVSFARPGGAQPGPDFYGGDTTWTEAPLMTGWPASVLVGTKGDQGEVKLPGDTRLPWFKILVPAWPGVQFRSGDVMTDDQALQMRYTLSSAVQTAQGWSLTASLAAS